MLPEDRVGVVLLLLLLCWRRSRAEPSPEGLGALFSGEKRADERRSPAPSRMLYLSPLLTIMSLARLAGTDVIYLSIYLS